MSGSELLIASMVVVQIVFAVLIVLLYRQVTIISLRLGLIQGPTSEPVLVVGKALPESVTRELPGLLDTGIAYLLWMTSTCASCRRLAEEIERRAAAEPLVGELVTLLSGSGEVANRMAERVSHSSTVLRDPDAERVVEALALDASPFVVEVEKGVITGWVAPDSLDDIRRLCEARMTSDAHEWAAGALADQA